MITWRRFLSREEQSMINVSLPPDLEVLVREKVASGMYDSVSDVFCEALYLLKDRDELKRIRLEELRREIAIGIEQIEKGEYVEYDDDSLHEMFEQIKTEGRRRIAEKRGQD